MRKAQKEKGSKLTRSSAGEDGSDEMGTVASTGRAPQVLAFYEAYCSKVHRVCHSGMILFFKPG